MALEHYDKFFGGKPGAARETLAAMKRTYGSKDGETVFYARVAKLKRRARPARKPQKRRR